MDNDEIIKAALKIGFLAPIDLLLWHIIKNNFYAPTTTMYVLGSVGLFISFYLLGLAFKVLKNLF